MPPGHNPPLRSLADLATTDFTFCDAAGPPTPLRVSSGEFTFGATATGGDGGSVPCVAEANYDDNSPRIDLDFVRLEDVTAEVGRQSP